MGPEPTRVIQECRRFGGNMRKIFDVHIHYPSEDLLGKPVLKKTKEHRQQLDNIAEACIKSNITKACILGGTGIVNQWVLDAAAAYPELFIPMAYIDLDSEIPENIDDYFSRGFKGFKIIATRKNYDHPDYFAFYERIQKLGMIILFHTGVLGGVVDYLEKNPKKVTDDERIFEKVLASFQTSSARQRAIYLDTIGMNFPDLKVIGAHLGYGEYDLACAVARWRRNVYFDVSGGDVVRRHIFERNLIPREISPKKLMFGSDCITERIGKEVDIWEEALEKAGLPDTDINDILYNNAAYLFKSGGKPVESQE